MLTLDQLNQQFGTNISQDAIDDLATEIFLDLQSDEDYSWKDLHGLQSYEIFRKATYDKLMKQFFIEDFISDQNRDINDLPEIVTSSKLKAHLSVGIAKLVALTLVPAAKIQKSDEMIDEKELQETQTAGAGGSSSVESTAPEHTIEIVNGDNTKTLKERLELRKQLNAITEENLRLRRLREEADNKDSDYSKVRYKLQSFVNGGTPYIDENGVSQIDGEKNGPSSYEAWRAGINNKKRDVRIKQEQEDRNSVFASPKHTTLPDPKTVLDQQSDSFLSWYLDKFGE
jgi:hypothetical protein